MVILVTGAAGYIGSITTQQLIKNGFSVVAIDNLCRGHREAVDPNATFINVDIGDAQELEEIFIKHQFEAVVHLSGEALVGESMANPQKYFYANVLNGIKLLDIMLKYKVDKIVFSSSAAVYGNPTEIPIRESLRTQPVNPYGESKLFFERVLHWYSYAYGLNYIFLRYFNAAGASAEYGEDHSPETHLIPNVIKVALKQMEKVIVFGQDYPTVDGTCVRDYLHVLDIAYAHILCINKLSKGACNAFYNLGTGKGYTVNEIIHTVEKVTGTKIPIVYHSRRSGDPPALIASGELARLELGWIPEQSDIFNIIDSAWKWHKKYPKGYRL